jgi:hypothetical protein
VTVKEEMYLTFKKKGSSSSSDATPMVRDSSLDSINNRKSKRKRKNKEPSDDEPEVYEMDPIQDNTE